MPHDGHHHHHHHHHPHDHNHDHASHLRSHMHGPDAAEAVTALAAQFIDGFRAAADKMAFLRLAGVPLEIPDGRGGPTLKLVDVQLTTEWQVGTASPSFCSRELSYLPFPGPMVDDWRSLLAAMDAELGAIQGQATSERYALAQQLFYKYRDTDNSRRVVERVKGCLRQG